MPSRTADLSIFILSIRPWTYFRSALFPSVPQTYFLQRAGQAQGFAPRHQLWRLMGGKSFSFPAISLSSFNTRLTHLSCKSPSTSLARFLLLSYINNVLLLLIMLLAMCTVHLSPACIYFTKLLFLSPWSFQKEFTLLQKAFLLQAMAIEFSPLTHLNPAFSIIWWFTTLFPYLLPKGDYALLWIPHNREKACKSI